MSRAAKTHAGFGLVELLVVLAIVGILASIALPTYAGHIARVRRVDGRSVLLQAAQWLERSATATGSYPTGALPAALAARAAPYYVLTSRLTSVSYTLEATPTGAQAGDRCGTLSLQQTGRREIHHAQPDATVDACWNR